MLKAKNTIVCPACGREWGLNEDLKEGDACPSDDCPSNETVQPTLDETIQRMKDEILADVKKGIVPKDVKSYGELHDFVDANEYGGFCEDGMADKLIEQFGGRTADEGMPDGMMKYLNDAQDAVSLWIVNGGIAEALAEYIELRVLVKPIDHYFSPVQEDEGVEGIYTVSILKAIPRSSMASVVLDVFHSDIAIKVLDNYEFYVFDPVTGQVLFEEDDHESYSGKEMGKDCEQLTVVAQSLYKVSIDGDGVVIVANNGKEAQAKWLNILYGLWDLLSDVPAVFDGNNVATINEPFLHFPVGTNREEIWRWFEKNPAFIVGDVMQGIRKQLTV